MAGSGFCPETGWGGRSWKGLDSWQRQGADCHRGSAKGQCVQKPSQKWHWYPWVTWVPGHKAWYHSGHKLVQHNNEKQKNHLITPAVFSKEIRASSASPPSSRKGLLPTFGEEKGTANVQAKIGGSDGRAWPCPRVQQSPCVPGHSDTSTIETQCCFPNGGWMHTGKGRKKL